MAVALQQGGGVCEEVGMRNAVDFKDDSLYHLLEKPGDGAAHSHSEAAALVHVEIEGSMLQGQLISCSISARVAGTFSASPGRSGWGPRWP